MSCFIAHPSVCRSYAKCHGWQETLAHFFVKDRRSATSSEDLSTLHKEKHIEPVQVGSHRASTSLTPPPPQIFEASSSPENSTHEKLTEHLDLSPIIGENASIDLDKTNSSPRPSIESNSVLRSISLLMDSKDGTPEFLERNNEDFQQSTMETIATSLKSSSNSREDLLSLVKNDNSNDDLTSMASSSDALNPLPRTTTMTSIKHLYSDEENNEQAGRLGPEVRQILGSLIGLLYDRNDDSALISRSRCYF